MLRVEGLAIRMEGETLFSPVHWQFSRGHIEILMGSNGVGKTQLFHGLARLRSIQGEVYWDEKPWQMIPNALWSRYCGYLFQQYPIRPAFSVQEVLGWYAWETPDPAMQEEALETWRLRSLAHRCVRELSVGQYKRVHLAGIWMRDPELYLLDEPFVHLDVEEQAWLQQQLKLLQDRGKIVILSTHQVHWVKEAGFPVTRLEGTVHLVKA